MENQTNQFELVLAKLTVPENACGCIEVMQVDFISERTSAHISKILNSIATKLTSETVENHVSKNIPIFGVYLTDTGLNCVYTKYIESLTSDVDFGELLNSLIIMIEEDYNARVKLTEAKQGKYLN